MEHKQKKYDVIIVGGGIAGLTAAAYIAKSGKSVLVCERQSKVGGLVQTFERDGVYFDGGLRSIENSGIVFPMLKQLGIEIEFVKSNITIGIEKSVVQVNSPESINDYELFLQQHFPHNNNEITAIILEIRKIMGYMDVLYGIDNPAFLNMLEDKKHLVTVIIPWLFKFLTTMGKIKKLQEPVEDYLRKFTNNQALIDVICQHFFQQTPTSFALSYFSLYLDYHYPKGGTATLIEKIENFILTKAGEIATNTTIIQLHPEKKYVIDNHNNQTYYNQLIWAGDLKSMYNLIPLDKIENKKLVTSITNQQLAFKDLKGGDSVFTVYLTVDEDKTYFSNICSGHFFYTPSKQGLSSVNKETINTFLNTASIDPTNDNIKQQLKSYLEAYFKYNTFEIAIPALRDANLAPNGKTGLIISLLYDYQIAKKVETLGWSAEIKVFLEQISIRILNDSIFPGIEKKVTACFSSSPLTIEKLTGNTDGGITGWAFTNKNNPTEARMLKVAKSVETPLPDIFQAGQWTYTPAGLPISILTGKLAADKITG